MEGLEAALDRAHRYREAGADLLFVEAPESESDVERIAAALGDVPLLFQLRSRWTTRWSGASV